MKFELFELERTQSLWENTVDFNLTETGMHPFTLEELLGEEEIRQLLTVRMGYGQTNGSIELRETISAMYPGSDIDNILVTNGSIEANFVGMMTLLEKGDEIVLMLPNYGQILGLARGFGAVVKPFYLKEELHWQPDLDELKNLVTPRTKVIAVCNPNNPTGAVLEPAAMDEIVRLADEVGAWVYSDEIYRGVELSGGEMTPSFYDRYDKTIVTGGLSKAYSLAGLRIGWLAGPRKEIAECWACRDYTTIATGVLSNKIACYALQPGQREKILGRSRRMLRENLAAFNEWAAPHENLFRYHPPQAGGFVFLSYAMDINSTELTDRLRKEKSVFVIPGDCFGMDRRIRIGIGSEREYLLAGLERVNEMLAEIL